MTAARTARTGRTAESEAGTARAESAGLASGTTPARAESGAGLASGARPAERKPTRAGKALR
jgi:hypothetical protein